MKPGVEQPVALELTADELQLVKAGLQLLLVVEDDHIAIEQLKEVLRQIDEKAAQAVR